MLLNDVCRISKNINEISNDNVAVICPDPSPYLHYNDEAKKCFGGYVIQIGDKTLFTVEDCEEYLK